MTPLSEPPDLENLDVYPLTIVSDRYGGAYSGGRFTAWCLDSTKVPADIHEDDVTCHNFWEDPLVLAGRGRTIERALNDLKRRMLRRGWRGEYFAFS